MGGYFGRHLLTAAGAGARSKRQHKLATLCSAVTTAHSFPLASPPNRLQARITQRTSPAAHLLLFSQNRVPHLCRTPSVVATSRTQ